MLDLKKRKLNKKMQKEKKKKKEKKEILYLRNYVPLSGFSKCLKPLQQTC